MPIGVMHCYGECTSRYGLKWTEKRETMERVTLHSSFHWAETSAAAVDKIERLAAPPACNHAAEEGELQNFLLGWVWWTPNWCMVDSVTDAWALSFPHF